MKMHTTVKLFNEDEKVLFIVDKEVADWLESDEEEVPEELLKKVNKAEDDNLPDFILQGEDFQNHIWDNENIDNDKANAIAGLYENFHTTEELMNYVSRYNIIIADEWQGFLY